MPGTDPGPSRSNGEEATRGLPARWWQRAQRPVDGAGLAAFRALFGALLLYSTIRFWAKGWIEELYLDPNFHFTYLGFDWVRPLPSGWMHVHVAAMAVAAAALALGLHTRLSALSYVALFTYAELIEKSAYLNHYYLVSLLVGLLCLVPAGASGSVDAWRRRRRGLSPRPVPAWAYWALRAQLVVVYFYAGFAKLNPDWLTHSEPLRTWLQSRAHLPVVGGLLSQPVTARCMSLAGALYDLVIPLALSFRATRPLAFAAVVLFHISVWALFPIGVFSWVMITSATLFFDPSWPRRLASRLRGQRSAERPSAAGGAAPSPGVGGPLPKTEGEGPTGDDPPGARLGASRAERLAFAFAGAHLVVQALVPLRFVLYPGSVNWHEQGFRFSWRVMLIEKAGQVEFEVLHPTGVRQRIYPQKELTPLQYKMMSTQPDMIQQYAHYLSASLTAPSQPPPAVYAHARCTLNGRPSQPLVDPEVNLAAQPRNFLTKTWIVPLRH